METISLALAIIKAVPILEQWFAKLFVAYTADKIATMKKENAEAIKKAIETGDQRPIETTIGSKNAGQLSGNLDSEVVDSLPGVRK